MWAWETSPQHPGVVRLHVHAFYFSTTARWVTSPTWGPPPPCKQALSLFCLYVQVWKRTTLSTLTEEDHSITLTYLQSSVPEHVFHAFLCHLVKWYRFTDFKHSVISTETRASLALVWSLFFSKTRHSQNLDIAQAFL